MAQFDLYALPDGLVVVDCQADLLSDLESRFVVPLLPQETVRAARRLNPSFLIEGERLTLFPQGAATIPSRELREPIGSLAGERFEILNAIDFLLTGA